MNPPGFEVHEKATTGGKRWVVIACDEDERGASASEGVVLEVSIARNTSAIARVRLRFRFPL